MNIFFDFIQTSGINNVFTLGFATLILLYTIFLLFVVNQVRSLNRLIFIRPANTSQTLLIIAIVQALVAFGLFLATLAIL